jgi:hypothetical protein
MYRSLTRTATLLELVEAYLGGVSDDFSKLAQECSEEGHDRTFGHRKGAAQGMLIFGRHESGRKVIENGNLFVHTLPEWFQFIRSESKWNVSLNPNI